jgi:periplasmic divalent cation tolerance protein
MDSGYSIVITTVDTEANAQRIVARVLDDRLAACAQLAAITSHYLWEGVRRSEAEIEIKLKIKTSDYAAVEQAIRAMHSYKVPQIVRIGILEGSADYLNWISAVTR